MSEKPGDGREPIWHVLMAVSGVHGLGLAYFPLYPVPFVCLLRDKVSLCSPGCSRTRSVDQAGLELTEIHSLLSAGIKGVHHHHPATLSLFQ